MTAIEAWVGAINEIRDMLPRRARVFVDPNTIRRLARLFDAAARASAGLDGECECRGAHRTGCGQAS